MLLGEQQLVDLTAVSGAYVTVTTLVAMAEEGVPPGEEAPFGPGESLRTAGEVPQNVRSSRMP